MALGLKVLCVCSINSMNAHTSSENRAWEASPRPRRSGPGVCCSIISIGCCEEPQRQSNKTPERVPCYPKASARVLVLLHHLNNLLAMVSRQVLWSTPSAMLCNIHTHAHILEVSHNPTVSQSVHMDVNVILQCCAVYAIPSELASGVNTYDGSVRTQMTLGKPHAEKTDKEPNSKSKEQGITVP